ncbi:hypothetical protein PHMEG_00021769, partial [Phytophthora megakarya]
MSVLDQEDIGSYNGDYAALSICVESMSVLDQVMCYTKGRMSRTRSFVKVENPETLSDAMDFAVKYEVVMPRILPEDSTDLQNDAKAEEEIDKGDSDANEPVAEPQM